jgi:glutathione S-transferase
MYRLYWSTNSAAMAPHGVLLETGQRFELFELDLGRGQHREPEYLKLNPNGRVPTLVVDGKHAIFESAAICMYLADRHPAAGLAPAIDDPARGLYLQWLAYMSNTLQPAYLRAYYPDRHTSDPDHAPEIAAAAEEELGVIWGRIDQAIGAGPYMLGVRYSTCDLYLLMLSTWQDPVPGLYQRFPNVKRCVDRVLQRPAVIDMMRKNGMAA